MKNYDVLVIGSGMTGMTIANKCARKGLKNQTRLNLLLNNFNYENINLSYM